MEKNSIDPHKRSPEKNVMSGIKVQNFFVFFPELEFIYLWC